MQRLTLLIPVIYLFFIAKVNAQGSNLTLSDLPKEVLEELLLIVGGQSLMDKVQCVEPQHSDIDLLLYTRNNVADPIVINPINPVKLDPKKKLVLVIHGWIQGTYGYGMQEVKNAFLSRYDCNVIIVNWERLAFDLYTHAVCKLPKVAKIIADFLCLVSKQSLIDLESVHLVGHSLGGQMSGLIGQSSNLTCKQTIDKITALDPAGPLYSNALIKKRLDKSDAKFVSVMHTNGGAFGYLNDCGHVDFYVNCGTLQPGCVIPKINLNSFMNISLLSIGCHHFRAMDLMVESILTNNFKATPCSRCPFICPPIASIFKSNVIMGDLTPTDTMGGYFLLTNFKSPYAVNL